MFEGEIRERRERESAQKLPFFLGYKMRGQGSFIVKKK